jgi:hypothetical protein
MQPVGGVGSSAGQQQQQHSATCSTGQVEQLSDKRGSIKWQRDTHNKKNENKQETKEKQKKLN